MNRFGFDPRRLPQKTVRPLYRPLLEELESRQLLSTNVLTSHNDLARTGLNSTETILTPDNVNSTMFGKLYSYPVDGQLYAQPLYVGGVTLPDGSVHDIVYVATEHDSVYAFDANGGGLLWQASFIDPAHGINTFNYQTDAHNCNQITPEIGITATPIISTRLGVMYVVDQYKDTSSGSPVYHQQLHALDITSGADVFGSPVEITGTFGSKTFNPQQYKDRPGLTMVNGVVYTSWSSHCDIGPAPGWMIGYDARTLQQVAVLNTAPTGDLDTLWQGGAAPAVDSNGFIYFETGNGTHGVNNGDYSESFVKVDGTLTPQDYFAPSNWQNLDNADLDIGSGGPIVLPDQPGNFPHLLVGGGKDGRIFVLNRDDMGQENTNFDRVVQELPNNTVKGGIWGTIAYFDAGDTRWIYTAGLGDNLRAFQLTDGLLSTNSISQSSVTFPNKGATPVVSANGTADSIVWAISNTNPAVLYAFDALDLSHQLYNSNQVTGDRLDNSVKFAVPTVADGKVFVGTQGAITIFGLRSSGLPGFQGSAVALNGTSFAHSTGTATLVPATAGSSNGTAATIPALPDPAIGLGSGGTGAQIATPLAPPSPGSVENLGDNGLTVQFDPWTSEIG
jgi:hypothetical protein